MSYILILGANGGIAKEVAKKYAMNGYDLLLAGRRLNVIQEIADEIHIVSNQDIKAIELDILDFESHADFYSQLNEKPFGVICAVGYLGDQLDAQDDFEEAKKIIDTNFTGIVSLLNLISNDFERRRSGFIVGISSVAGERGRKSNYIYGSSKAAFSTYLSGLRARLNFANVHVLTVKPGYVETSMIKGLNLPKILIATAEDTAKLIYSAQQKKRNIVYIKTIWRLIILIIKSIPEWKFKGMSV
jgi:decaprenylphospho-beta-D-erythro-pentofuranosid-2-ulose 2-reductase